jgi:hypothetical protein
LRGCIDKLAGHGAARVIVGIAIRIALLNAFLASFFNDVLPGKRQHPLGYMDSDPRLLVSAGLRGGRIG